MDKQFLIQILKSGVVNGFHEEQQTIPNLPHWIEANIHSCSYFLTLQKQLIQGISISLEGCAPFDWVWNFKILITKCSLLHLIL